MIIDPIVYFQRDAVPMEDVRTAILARRLAALPENSADRVGLQEQLNKAVQVSEPSSPRADQVISLDLLSNET